jgi:hypothetical protein
VICRGERASLDLYPRRTTLCHQHHPCRIHLHNLAVAAAVAVADPPSPSLPTVVAALATIAAAATIVATLSNVGFAYTPVSITTTIVLLPYDFFPRDTVSTPVATNATAFLHRDVLSRHSIDMGVKVDVTNHHPPLTAPPARRR